MDLFNEQTQEAIRAELAKICQRYNLTELITLGEMNGKQTFIMQYSPNRSNPFFNSVYESLQAEMTETAKQHNVKQQNLFNHGKRE